MHTIDGLNPFHRKTLFFQLWWPLRDLGLGIPLLVSSLWREQSLHYKHGRRFQMEGLAFRSLSFALVRHWILIMLAWIHRLYSQSHHQAPPSFHRSSMGSIDNTLFVLGDQPTWGKPRYVRKKQIKSYFAFLIVIVVSFRFSLQHVSLRHLFIVVEGLSTANMFTSGRGVKGHQVDSILGQLIIRRSVFKGVKWKLQMTVLFNRSGIANTCIFILCGE